MSSGQPQPALYLSSVERRYPQGDSFLVYDNFRTLMVWNRSTYFALSVGLLSDLLEDS